MRERGKGAEMFSSSSNNNNRNGGSEYFQDYTTEALPCKRHPYSSSVGVCAYCLKERLVSLVCADCGEQRLSSCSCSSGISSNRNSTTGDVGSIGRISFLLENDHGKSTNTTTSTTTSKERMRLGGENNKQEEILSYLLKSSSSVEIKRRNGFWRIGRMFRKKRLEKGINGERNSSANCEGTKSTSGSDVWVVDYMGGVSRSRSLCSFRGGGGGVGFFGSEDGSTFSGARSSVSNARSSGFNGGLLFDPERRSGFSEPEPRRSGFDGDRKDSIGLDHDQVNDQSQSACNNTTRRVFSLKEGNLNFTTLDDSGFIDLKFDHLPTNISEGSKLEANSPAVKLGSLSDSNTAFGSMRSGDHLVGDGFVPHGGSCRITVGERGNKRSRKSFKSWRWIFRHHVPSSKKNNDVQVVKDY